MKESKTFYLPKLVTFYTENQAVREPVGFSRSPMKPYLLMNKIEGETFSKYFEVQDNFPPFSEEDFQIAHEEEYVKDFFDGISPAAGSNGLTWTPEFAETVKYTNSSLYHAQKYAVENPNCITFSPTSGFHHAIPEEGDRFCTFSGQVISAIKLYREKDICTAWIDMDGHDGNSIEESRDFLPELEIAIPEICNLNPRVKGRMSYLKNLSEGLDVIANEVLDGRIHSICFAQGADSHSDDELAPPTTSVGTQDWVEAHRMVFQKVKEISEKMGKPIPLTISLFGGYRDDDYESVLNLHCMNLISCLEILCGVDLKFGLEDSGERILLARLK